MRLQKIVHEYQDRLKLRLRAFPLELLGGEAAPRRELEQEWWLAALQEPAAEFRPFTGDDWPTTTLPAFDAAWCAFQQGTPAGFDYDLRVRRAFFAEGRNIGRKEVLLEIAEEAGLEMAAFRAALDSDIPRIAVIGEFQTGRDTYNVRSTPILMMANGRRLRLPIAPPRMQEGRIVSVRPLPCCGEGCLDAMRGLLDSAISEDKDGDAEGAEADM